MSPDQQAPARSAVMPEARPRPGEVQKLSTGKCEPSAAKCWRQIRCAWIAKSTYIEFPSLEVKEKRNG
jgi:hypothetical protein